VSDGDDIGHTIAIDERMIPTSKRKNDNNNNGKESKQELVYTRLRLKLIATSNLLSHFERPRQLT